MAGGGASSPPGCCRVALEQGTEPLTAPWRAATWQPVTSAYHSSPCMSVGLCVCVCVCMHFRPMYVCVCMLSDKRISPMWD